MIKENITTYVNSYVHEGEIIVPSAVVTSTPQNETMNLSLTPNFTLKLNDTYGYIKNDGDIFVTFNINSYNYNAYMNVINRSSNNIVTLQYLDGLTYEAGDEPEPEPDPVLSQSINNILGSNYDVINDMSDEDALAAANNILYGDEEPPR